jgi:hypothetical protein
MELAEAAAPIATGAPWRPPPFCRVSWTSERSRSLWEPRLEAARDAVEDLAVLRAARDGSARLAFVRPASLRRLNILAKLSRVAITAAPSVLPRPHDVAAGRAGRAALLIGAESWTPPEEVDPDDEAEDPIWRLARQIPEAETFDDGRGLIVAGHWAANPMLAAIGLAASPPSCWSFAPGGAEAEGEALLADAAEHGRAEAIADLREALSWPISWTALHGAAEVKTPLFRFIRNSPPTGRRLSVRRLGAAMPEGAARGLGFPFTNRAGAGEKA